MIYSLSLKAVHVGQAFLLNDSLLKILDLIFLPISYQQYAISQNFLQSDCDNLYYYLLFYVTCICLIWTIILRLLLVSYLVNNPYQRDHNGNKQDISAFVQSLAIYVIMFNIKSLYCILPNKIK